MITPPLTNDQMEQNLARILVEDLWSIQSATGGIHLSEEDYKQVRVNIVKAIGIIQRYSHEFSS